MSTPIDLSDLYHALTGIDMVNDIRDISRIDSKSLVLEAGCGSGKMGLNIAIKTGAMVVLMDNDPSVIEIVCKHVMMAEVILHGARLPVVIRDGDIKNIPQYDNTFDLVFNEGVLEHFQDPIPVIEEMKRVSRDVVLAVVPHALNPKQVELAKSQTAQYAGKDHWAAYEVPWTEEEAMRYFQEAGFGVGESKLIWPEPDPARSKEDYRMVLVWGRKYG